MIAKIVQIMNRDGSPKTSDEALNRIGRTMDTDHSIIVTGSSAFLYCVYPGFDESFITSQVVDLLKTESEVIIWTRNSIYRLERLCE